MQHLKVFVKTDCPNCPAAKELANRFPDVEIYDVEQPEGLAEAAFYSVMCTPSIVLVDEGEKEVHAWRCMVPTPGDIAEHIN
ncbi:MAG: glutaredoxin domain-containing protein [Actinomycetota bacterium]|nr:glutaredoxin domain-containing protein [Actinomycetota bacterium]